MAGARSTARHSVSRVGAHLIEYRTEILDPARDTTASMLTVRMMADQLRVSFSRATERLVLVELDPDGEPHALFLTAELGAGTAAGSSSAGTGGPHVPGDRLPEEGALDQSPPGSREEIMTLAMPRHRFTVQEYDRMAEVGVFDPDARLELIHGEIVEMTPIGPDHQSEVDRLTDLFTSRIGRRAQVRVQGPVHVGRYSEPQPDLLLLRRRDDYYRAAHPDPADVLLVVEVADSSLKRDQSVKVPLYMDESIREAWIVNLVEEVLEVYRRSAPEDPVETLRLARGQSITLLAFPDVTLAVDEILG